jgi:adenylyltransferase/sulfurtransferase
MVADRDDRRREVELSNEELLRYSRHLLLPEVGITGQRALKGASVLVAGAGGLGSPAAMYLAAAGIGTIGVLDSDAVDLTNLQRQLLHATTDVGRPKTESARETIDAINPHVAVRTHPTRLTAANAFGILSGYDVILDGTDNFPTRYLLNDACVLLGKPNVYGSVFRFEGQAGVFDPARGGPCYRCLYPSPPPPGTVPSCAEGGVLGVLPGIVGTIQALSAIRLILGLDEGRPPKLILIDGTRLEFREVRLKRQPDCRLCGPEAVIKELIDYEDFCGLKVDGPDPGGEGDMTVEELKSRLDRGEEFLILDVREPPEYAICNLGGRLIPVNELPARIGELDPAADIVVHCKTGGRSARAVGLLRQAGFRQARNLAGGIAAWAERIDPTMPRY